MFEGFVNPALVAGVALASVPIIIHLLNRQRHKPTPWAAMRFVLAAYRQTRRRVQVENWLLLLLRALAVAALALAIARPFTDAAGPLGGLTESRRDVAIVIDGSASMGYRSEVDSVFERTVARARELVEELDGGRGDRAHLVLGGAWPRLLAWGDPRNALVALDALTEPTDEEIDLALALDEVLEFAKEEAASTQQSRVEVRLLTDLQRGSFTRDALAITDAAPGGDGAAEGSSGGLFDVLDELAALDIEVRVEDLSGGELQPPNLSIRSLEIDGALIGEGAPVEVRVRVANHGDLPRIGLRVALEIDGVRRPSQIVDVEGQSTTDAIFPVVFDRSGDHALVARLEGDRLAIDDHRTQVVHVPEPVRVLVVNGAPSADFEEDAAARLLVVLEPLPAEDGLGGAPSPFAPIEVEPRALERGDVKLDEFDLVWLVNVESLSPEVVASLEERVAAGAALVMTLGDRVQRETFNERFFRPDGSGLSPAELERVVSVASRREDYYRIRQFEEQHPALALFAEQRWRSLFTEAPFYDFFAARPQEDASVLARLDDPGGSPLLIEREYDRGRVLLWTSSMQESWTGFPTWGPALVPFVYDIVRYAGVPTRPASTLAPGGSFTAEVERFPRSIELVLPDDSRRTIDAESVEVTGSRWRLPSVEGASTARAGLYRIETEGAGSLAFAVQVAPDESQLARLGPGELEGLHEGFRLIEAESEDAGDSGLPQSRGELWRGLALAALLFLIGESLWSAWIGRRRRVVA